MELAIVTLMSSPYHIVVMIRKIAGVRNQWYYL